MDRFCPKRVTSVELLLMGIHGGGSGIPSPRREKNKPAKFNLGGKRRSTDKKP